FLIGACSTTINEFQSDGWDISSQARTINEIEAASVADIQKTNETSNRRSPIPLVPFGYGNKHWVKFKEKVQEGDEIRFVKNRKRGSGYALIRDGKVVDTYLYFVINAR
ncbi:hypothetical protein ACQV5M_20195, partial [Leptospira sp. SA-E8]|uniref:hypothetical protein n=1 Tax=Leptospira sp. SA-E8 TaxID=3422259 RepID=UPI003EB76E8E